jgi:hypothetical protein
VSRLTIGGMEGVDPRTDGELLVATRADPEAFAVF